MLLTGKLIYKRTPGIVNVKLFIIIKKPPAKLELDEGRDRAAVNYLSIP